MKHYWINRLNCLQDIMVWMHLLQVLERHKTILSVVANVVQAVAVTRRSSLVVDNVFDGARTRQVSGERVSELDTWVIWCSDSTIDINVVISEERVNTNTVCSVACHLITNIVACISGMAIVGIDVVWQFRLVVDIQTVVTVPDSHVTESMFNMQAIRYNVVTIDD